MSDDAQTPATPPAEDTAPDYIGTATYSPEDNKIRITAFSRLPKELYQRVRAAGFIWAPRQEIFVAPMWTPDREDFAEELCGEIGDEDQSLVERAEARAERFEDYSDKRERDANRAHKAVSAICDGIPLGQPILVGHHSERRARKDAERIENGMRKAVKMWETSEYWTRRAAGALRHAKYKELPGVRARRIKTIEADRRRQMRYLDSATAAHVFWLRPDLTHAEALRFAGGSGFGFDMPKKEGDRKDFDQRPSAYTALSNAHPTLYAPRTLEEVIARALEIYPRTIERYTRWIAHYDNRLAYEKAMLEEQGASHLIAPTKRPTQLPLLNYRQATITINSPWERGKKETLSQAEMTTAEFMAIYDGQRGTRIVDGTHRIRFCLFQRDDSGKVCRFPRHSSPWCAVFLTDSKTHPKPGAPTPPPPEPTEQPQEDTVCPDGPACPDPICQAERAKRAAEVKPEPVEDKGAKFEALKQTLRAGVQVVSAPQLFPTPPDLCRRMVELADLSVDGLRVLEPEGGTGAILRAIKASAFAGTVITVELSVSLAGMLKKLNLADDVRQCDFLECNSDLGKFDRVIMNPPFIQGADVKHILHARTFLKPGGILVAICAGGPKQEEKLQPLADSWERLPDDTFKEQGTNVRTILLTMSAPDDAEDDPAPTPPAPADPETELRAIWDAKGVSKARQDELIADCAAKAQPGAMVGPFVIPHAIAARGPQLELAFA